MKLVRLDKIQVYLRDLHITKRIALKEPAGMEQNKKGSRR